MRGREEWGLSNYLGAGPLVYVVIGRLSRGTAGWA